MAELYPPGVQRIYYKATGDDDLEVTATLLDPSLIIENHHVFSRVPGTSRIYYADVNFYTEGIWVAIFKENGVEKVVQAYNTKKIPAEGEFRMRGNKGPNVIGG